MRTHALTSTRTNAHAPTHNTHAHCVYNWKGRLLCAEMFVFGFGLATLIGSCVCSYADPREYVSSNYNRFDAIILAVSIIQMIQTNINIDASDTAYLKVRSRICLLATLDVIPWPRARQARHSTTGHAVGHGR